ncbi:hypothetical protein D3H64_01245 [Atopobacter sp. AH10]|uniref:hypothetical protein n=1 Tax=Atopobacter sp. AH10 TaxID=2315861 RepID=UPI000EF27C3F|nr:hypothetical protein [Atopobacter sp. AH10]RLK64178.1 hypothetical protein D3H64_01245 [Atopobacter sp. AH10]
MLVFKSPTHKSSRQTNSSIWLIALCLSIFFYLIGNPSDLGFILMIISVVLLAIDLFITHLRKLS